MLKRLILSVIFISISVITLYADNNTKYQDNGTVIIPDNMSRPASFDEDYFIGLKAYEDGFMDIAKSSLEAFLKKKPRVNEADFARYIIYQIYLKEGKTDDAINELSKISNTRDERFDKDKINSDKMSLLVKKDCDEAKRYMIADNVTDVVVYLKSECKIDKDVINYILKSNQKSDIIIFALDKSKADKNVMTQVYDSLTKEQRTEHVLNYFGKYFVINKMNKEFYTLYKDYKDKDLTEAALNLEWGNSNFKGYVDLFKRDVKAEYDLQPATYCRMIESSSKIGISYSCELLDGCMKNDPKELNRAKLSCLVKSNDKEAISVFMSKLIGKDAAALCDFSRYIVRNKLYTNNFLFRFNGCKEKVDLYEDLASFKDADAIITLSGFPKDQADYAYLAYAYHLKGNKSESKKNLDKVKDKKYQDIVKKLIGK